MMDFQKKRKKIQNLANGQAYLTNSWASLTQCLESDKQSGKKEGQQNNFTK